MSGYVVPGFRAAIECLEQLASNHSRDHGESEYCPCEGYRAAIRLLKVVGEIDMEGVVSYYEDTMKLVYDGLPVPEDRWDYVIGTILQAALPTKGE